MTTKSPGFEEKRSILEDFLEHGPAMIHLDARQPGVRVPPWLQDDLQLRLKVSPRFDPPDLQIDAWGIRQTLSFQGRRFPVAVPWNAVFGMSDAHDELRLFPASMPYELFEAIAIAQGLTREEFRQLQQKEDAEPGLAVISFSAPEESKILPRVKPGSAMLTMVTPPGEFDEAETDVLPGTSPTSAPPIASDEEKAARRAHLRVVK